MQLMVSDTMGKSAQTAAISPRRMVINWIDEVLRVRGWNGTVLAKKANLAPSTILRLLNSPDHQFVPSLRTLRKISNGASYPMPDSLIQMLSARTGIEPEDLMNDTPEKVKDRSDFFRSDFEDAMHRAQTFGEVAKLSSRMPGVSGRPVSTQVPSVRMVKVKKLSMLPTSLRPTAPSVDASVEVPSQLVDDQTIFAAKMPDASLEPFIKSGSMLYISQSRDPVGGDMIMITEKSGKSAIRGLREMNEKGFELMKPGADDRHVVNFDEIEDWGIVVGMVRS